MKSDKAMVPSRRGDRRHELAFLPAALEIVETPPSPIGRAVGWTIVAVFCVALAWAMVGTIDIVASAQGKIVPSERTKVIQPFETGVVRAIYVQDGQTVKAGDTLITLDPTMNEAERDRLRSDLIGERVNITRLRAALAANQDPGAGFDPPKEAPAGLIATQRQLLIDQVAEHRAKLAVLERQVAQKEAERETLSASINKIRALLDVSQQRVDIRKSLADRELGSKLQYIDAMQQLVEQREEIAVQESRQREAAAAIAGLRESRIQAAAEYRRAIFDELSKAEQKANALEQDLIKAEQRTKFQTLTAPVDGTVQQLAVHTIGGVVTPAQALLAVVPGGSQLEIEAMLSNRDVGFVRPGQGVEIKVDTFNFTRYGLLHGTVMSISSDAVVRNKPADAPGDPASGAQNATSEPAGQSLLYAARISLDRTQMQVEENLVNLSPGMAVTAEIRTGSRSVISYLLSPIMRYRQESLRER